MACKGFLECLLKLLNLLLTLVGLAMVGYGIYLLVEYKRAGTANLGSVAVLESENHELISLGRPMLIMVSSLSAVPSAWFIYVFIGIGVILFVISVFGCIGAVTRHPCCLSCYSALVILLILVELAFAGFLFFDKSWKDVIPTDKTGDFDMIYDFLKLHWKIVRWVALGAVILEALVFVLAVIVQVANKPAEYDSDEEYINPRSGNRQPLINKPGAPATGVPATANPDQRPSRIDAWSKRMREKYGLDTSEFSYDPSEANRFQQGTAPPVEERSRCSIM